MASIKRISQEFHMYIHLIFGALAYFLYTWINPSASSFMNFLFALISNILPDIDHLLFFFVYGSKTDYSISVKKLLKSHQYKKAAKYCMENHKKNTSIISHNILSFAFFLIICSVSIFTKNNTLGIIALSWSYHYLFDMVEDYLFFGKLNPNWMLRFGTRKC